MMDTFRKVLESVIVIGLGCCIGYLLARTTHLKNLINLHSGHSETMYKLIFKKIEELEKEIMDE